MRLLGGWVVPPIGIDRRCGCHREHRPRPIASSSAPQPPPVGAPGASVSQRLRGVGGTADRRRQYGQPPPLPTTQSSTVHLLPRSSVTAAVGATGASASKRLLRVGAVPPPPPPITPTTYPSTAPPPSRSPVAAAVAVGAGATSASKGLLRTRAVPPTPTAATAAAATVDNPVFNRSPRSSLPCRRRRWPGCCWRFQAAAVGRNGSAGRGHHRRRPTRSPSQPGATHPDALYHREWQHLARCRLPGTSTIDPSTAASNASPPQQHYRCANRPPQHVYASGPSQSTSPFFWVGGRGFVECHEMFQIQGG